MALALRGRLGHSAFTRPINQLEDEAAVCLGTGICQIAVSTVCEEFGFIASKHSSTSSLESIDKACRLLLVAAKSADSLQVMGKLYDASLLLGSSSVTFSVMQGCAASAVPIPAATLFPPFPSADVVVAEFSVPTSLPSSSISSPPPTSLSLSLDAPPSSPPLIVLPAVPVPRSICAVPTSGVMEQCFYRAVGKGLEASSVIKSSGALYWNKLDKMLRKSLASITDASLLSNFGFDIDPSIPGDGEINRAKTEYLTSSNFVNQRWGGTKEMYLLSHLSGGELAFQLFSNVTAKKSYSQMICAFPSSSLPRTYAFGDQPHPQRELALHYCNVCGEGGANHFEPIQYVMADGESMFIWPHVLSESALQTSARHATIVAACKQSVVLARETSKKEAAANAAEVVRLLALQSPSSPLPLSPPSNSARKSAASRPVKPPLSGQNAPKAARIAPNRPSKPPCNRGLTAPLAASPIPSSALPPAMSTSEVSSSEVSQPSVWREIPSSCRSHFVAVASPPFITYGKLSADGKLAACADVLNIILDLPGKVLLKNGKVRELQQQMERQMDQWSKLQAIQEAVVVEATTVELPPEIYIPASLSLDPTPPSPSPPFSLSLPLSPTSSVVIPSQDSAESDSPKDSDSSGDAGDHCDNSSDFTSDVAGEDAIDPAAEVLERSIKRAVRIVREGAPRALSRAVRALEQAPSVSINSHTIDQLRDLHPAATEHMAPLPRNKALEKVAVDPATVFTLLKNRVNNGSAPGPSGWTGSHLQLLADSGSDEVKTGICLMIKDICNGVFGGATKQRLLASVLMPIGKKPPSIIPLPAAAQKKRKPNSSPSPLGIRPIAMGEVFVKLAAHFNMSLIEEHLPSLFPRIQYGVKRAGGSESAAQLTRALLSQSSRLHPSTIALKTDFQNAFNSASRARIWKTMLEHPSTEAIWRMFYWAYSSPSDLLVFDRGKLFARLMSSEGVRQGDPFAAFAFALSVQSLYKRVIADLPECHAVSILDDLTLIGPQEQVFTAFDRIQQMAAEYHLQLRVEKCAVHIPAALTDESLHTSIVDACKTRQLSHAATLETLGVMLGSNEQVRTHAMTVVDSHHSLFSALQHPSMPTQIAFSLLRYCALPRLGFLARTIHPSQFLPAAERFDSLVMETFRNITQIAEETKQPSVPADQLSELISLPISAGGMGLRPMQRISHSAYFASSAAILPDFIQSFPPSQCADYSATELHAHLQECREAMLKQGVGNGSDINSSALPTVAAEAKITGKRGPKPKAAKVLPVKSRPPMYHSSSSLPTSSSPYTITFHSSIDSLWKRAQAHIKTRGQLSFLQAEKLQHDATMKIEERIQKELHARSVPFRQALLTANAVPHSAAFLTVLPTQPCYRMADAAMRLGMRHRLGLLPYEQLANKSCVCRFHTPFIADPDHFHSCDKFKRTFLTQRHNNLVQVLMDLAINAGFTAIREPNSHLRPEDVSEQAPLSKDYNLHADILLLKHDLKLYVDVTVCRPTNSTNLTLKSSLTKPLHSTRAPASGKHSKYDEIAKINGYKMIPFAIESYGGIGREGSDFLRTLAAHSREYTPAAFLLHARKRLSVTLQSSNANIAQLAMQQFHLHHHSRNPASYEAHLKKKAAIGYCEPSNADYIDRCIQPTLQAASAAIINQQLADSDNSSNTPSFTHDSRIAFADRTIAA